MDSGEEGERKQKRRRTRTSPPTEFDTNCSTNSKPSSSPSLRNSLSKTYGGNVGLELLLRMGWKEGTGLGLDESGIKTPVKAFHQKGKRGIGTCGCSTGAATATRKALEGEEKVGSEGCQVKERGNIQQQQKQKEQRRRKEKEDRMLARGIYRSFRTVESRETGTHPLAGPNRLSSSNPLLQDDDSE